MHCSDRGEMEQKVYRLSINAAAGPLYLSTGGNVHDHSFLIKQAVGPSVVLDPLNSVQHFD